ncbi:MAG: helix-turn-helix transcriptional regulator [Ferruginibacter sp.]|nr:helix-turn-helix transcriptional regulator [Chitinophagaceae bacterium]
MEVYIKNMVCPRCIKTVTGIFRDAGVTPGNVRLGSVEIDKPVTSNQEQVLRKALETEGFEWLDDQKIKLVEKLKQEIIRLVHYSELDEMKENLSDHLAAKLHKDYHYLSSIFSFVENNTIEQYFILQKIEKVKEWLVYNELTLNEMAFKLRYSSGAHLSGQFKKVTGFTPSQFKKLGDHHRKPLDQL